MDKFRALQFFIAAIEEGSFAGAAKRYATDPSTVSKSIKRLEQTLGLQLLQRSTRQLSLTTTGQTYFETVHDLASRLSLCEEELKTYNDAPAGKLKINLPVSYGRLYVQPMLWAFRMRYPDINLDVTYSDEYVDMIGKGIDVSIRSGHLNDSRLVAQKLSPMEFVVCASPSYIAATQTPINEANYAHHVWIRFRFKQTGKLMPIVINDYDKGQVPEVGEQIVVDDGEAMASACAAGLGITQIPHFVAKSWVERGELKVVSRPYRLKEGAVYIIYPKREFMPQRSRLFIDFVKDWNLAQGENPQSTWLSKT